ncbi:hypothetical protein CC78DRAFT_574906 [Lojkania enalia]|uniref:Uncharacterized protein n=1 Tax=Lojkania enalia TaxID=147567 RepID=A0A9P4N9Y7_9PLEO|nr:hypothetical protein CC78DRAFT_574906 [Didymosphaeria enalia]
MDKTYTSWIVSGSTPSKTDVLTHRICPTRANRALVPSRTSASPIVIASGFPSGYKGNQSFPLRMIGSFAGPVLSPLIDRHHTSATCSSSSSTPWYIVPTTSEPLSNKILVLLFRYQFNSSGAMDAIWATWARMVKWFLKSPSPVAEWILVVQALSIPVLGITFFIPAEEIM